MAHINLLPWREKLRKQRQREFGLMAVADLLVTVAGMGYWHFFVQGQIDHQKDRNRFLEGEIAKVDNQIREIRDLERTRSKLVSRMKVIEDLQVSRPQIVHLFDEMVTVVPDGSYLTGMTQRGSQLILDGRAQSNARVSTYMRNIENSPWMNAPKLRIIENKDTANNRGDDDSTFQLELVQVVPKGESGQ
jgi:type IV pilus assembly protein PilN